MENPVYSNKITKVVITPKRTADGAEVRGGLEPVRIDNIVGEILYYETLFSPTTTATIIIANPNAKQKLADTFQIQGGEKIEFELMDYVSKNNKDTGYGLKQTMYVDQVTAYNSNQFVEVFKLNCSSTWVDTLDNIQVTGTLTGTASNIANQIYKTNFNKDITYRDPSTEQISAVFGATKKDEPFPAIIELASKASTKNNAGFFFYQTKFGHHFKSLDGLIEEGKAKKNQQTGALYEYTYTGINPGIENPNISAVTILSLDQRFNNWTFKKAARFDQGIRTSFDPITSQSFYQPISGGEAPENYYKYEGLDLKTVFENPEDFKKALEASNFKFSGKPEMIFRNPDDFCLLSENPYKTKVPATARYTNFFARMITMVVPANTSLIAGSAVKLNIKKVKEGVNCSTEDEIIDTDAAGLYIVAAVCHAFDQQKAYSSVFLVRDLPFRKKN